jgi:phosphoribosylformylglycinamidine cyclo-ligase
VTTYSEAGVDLSAADRHVRRITPAVTSTWNESVVGPFGGFAAGVIIPPGYRRPVLMMTTDGVGTKLELARLADHWAGVGYDLVAMVVDDLAAVGARPIGLVDYLAVGAISPERDAGIVASIARACMEAHCPLLGGETAEHPGVMDPERVDLAAAALGVVEQGEELGPNRVEVGDVVIGLSSPHLRSNGFSLVRSVVSDRRLDDPFPGEDSSLAEVLLRPSVIYSPAIAQVPRQLLKAGAHITGGGLPGNLPRMLPAGLGAEIEGKAWTVPSVFRVIQQWGKIAAAEMTAVFNLGIGFCLIAGPRQAEEVMAAAGHDATVIGKVVPGSGVTWRRHPLE